MATNPNVVLVKMPDNAGKPGPTYKINKRDSARVEQLVDAGGVVISAGYEMKGDSHSDQAIDGVNAFVDAGLTEPQAEALIAAGYAVLEAAQAASDADLDEVDGIGPATVQKIREA